MPIVVKPILWRVFWLEVQEVDPKRSYVIPGLYSVDGAGAIKG